MTAIAAKAKMEQVLAIGADRVINRDEDVALSLGENSVDVVIDNVAGPAFGGMLKALKRGGRYASSGAIGGPLVTLDMRTFYLKGFDIDWLHGLGRTGFLKSYFLYRTQRIAAASS